MKVGLYYCDGYGNELLRYPILNEVDLERYHSLFRGRSGAFVGGNVSMQALEVIPCSELYFTLYTPDGQLSHTQTVLIRNDELHNHQTAYKGSDEVIIKYIKEGLTQIFVETPEVSYNSTRGCVVGDYTLIVEFVDTYTLTEEQHLGIQQLSEDELQQFVSTLPITTLDLTKYLDNLNRNGIYHVVTIHENGSIESQMVRTFYTVSYLIGRPDVVNYAINPIDVPKIELNFVSSHLEDGGKSYRIDLPDSMHKETLQFVKRDPILAYEQVLNEINRIVEELGDSMQVGFFNKLNPPKVYIHDYVHFRVFVYTPSTHKLKECRITTPTIESLDFYYELIKPQLVYQM